RALEELDSLRAVPAAASPRNEDPLARCLRDDALLDVDGGFSFQHLSDLSMQAAQFLQELRDSDTDALTFVEQALSRTCGQIVGEVKTVISTRKLSYRCYMDSEELDQLEKLRQAMLDDMDDIERAVSGHGTPIGISSPSVAEKAMAHFVSATA